MPLQNCLQKDISVSHVHLRYVRPFPKNLGDIFKNFEHVLIPEINNGQLIKIIRDQYFVMQKDTIKSWESITKHELMEEIRKML